MLDGIYTQLWIGWIALFAVIEGSAIANKKPGDTLSEHVWKWFKVTDKSAGWNARRGILVAFLVWLLAHLGWRLV